MELTDTSIVPTTFEIMAQFDEELSKLESWIEAISSHLNPVLENGANAVMGPAAEEAPYHDLHNSILRLRRYNCRLAELNSRIRL